jgi:hypothetical protein
MKLNSFSRKLQAHVAKQVLTVASKKARKFTTRDLEAKAKYELLKVYRTHIIKNGDDKTFDLRQAVKEVVLL